MKKELLQKIRKRLILSHKTAIFLLCFILSTVFWVFTSLSREYETHITIPVNYRNIPFTKYFDSELPRELEYHFRGTGFKLAGVHFRDRPDSIVVDVSTHSDKNKQLQFQTIVLRNQFPGEIKPYRIIPENITAGFNSRLSKRVPVRLIGQISYKPRFEATGVARVTPDSVDLAGHADLLAKVEEVRTTKLLLPNVAGNMTGTVSLDSTSYAGLASSTSIVSYFLPVEEFTEGIMEIPVELPVSQRNRVTIIPATVRITYTASLTEFSQIKNTDFRAEASVPVSNMPVKLPVTIKKQPPAVRILKIEPEFLDYLVQK